MISFRQLRQCVWAKVLSAAVATSPLLIGQDGSISNSILESEHLAYGFPGSHGKMLSKRYYIVSHRGEARVPEWTAHKVRRNDLIDNFERTDDFRPDLELGDDERAELRDYAKPFDRGHLAPADDFTKSLSGMSMSFLLSNMAPQHGSLNRGKWRSLESNAQSVARKFDSCWIYTGTIFNRTVEKHRTLGELKNGSQRTIGRNRVWVPTHFYKVILAHDKDGNAIAWAFLMKHMGTKLPGKVSDYAVSVDRIEELTDLDFFSELSDDVESELERKVNKAWPVK